jgi:D-lactate dehydrogenase (cytochrome)
MEAEHGDSLDLMRQIKHAFDPHNLMNPGKVIPA